MINGCNDPKSMTPFTFDPQSKTGSEFGISDPEIEPEKPIEPETQKILGCMDPQALNFEPTATTDDGSCEYDIGIEPEDPNDLPPIDQALMERMKKLAGVIKN